MKALKEIGMFVIEQPFLLFAMISVYLSSFLLRAYAWYLYMQKKVFFKTCVSGIFYSMFFNHLLPFKGGELVRIGTVLLEKKRKLNKDEVIHSVIVMRLLDVLTLISITAIGFFLMFNRVYLSSYVIVGLLFPFVIVVTFFFLTKNKLQSFYKRHLNFFLNGFRGIKGIFTILMVICSWIFEGIVVMGLLMNSPNAISFLEAIWVNSLTVGGQFFQVTPGGAATYETIMTFGLKILGISYSTGLSVAIISHLFKYIFSFVVGTIAFKLQPIDLTNIRSLFKERGFS